ncbi:aminoacyl--tRNA ligase-related protein [Ideonella sp. A 288]|uniref:aminoacyl--tRNA ligase-related protein n=1 Tax=Ideonella sp. A 288 TaxID=1962181 RepID=UPI000B4BD7C5|nr:aminoacyl--tRNA ligase-related protein [Ideonella sp. A 288]
MSTLENSGPADQGLQTLDESQLTVLRRIDEVLRLAGRQCGAKEIGFPSLSSVESLSKIDYFRNFPHLGLAVAALRADKVSALAADAAGTGDSFESDALVAPRYFLPSAACYPIYAHLRDRELVDAERVTTVQRCFRNEERFEGLARLLAFTMREVVVVGAQAQVREFLEERKRWVQRFASGLGLDLAVQVATDPFFEAGGQRARMQQLFPVKEEFVFDGSVAVSSVNFHRNFFGQRWNIRTADGEFAFSGCVAFGLERWLHALTRRWSGDAGAILEMLDGSPVGTAST